MFKTAVVWDTPFNHIPGVVVTPLKKGNYSIENVTITGCDILSTTEGMTYEVQPFIYKIEEVRSLIYGERGK